MNASHKAKQSYKQICLKYTGTPQRYCQSDSRPLTIQQVTGMKPLPFGDLKGLEDNYLGQGITANMAAKGVEATRNLSEMF